MFGRLHRFVSMKFTVIMAKIWGYLRTESKSTTLAHIATAPLGNIAFKLKGTIVMFKT